MKKLLVIAILVVAAAVGGAPKANALPLCAGGWQAYTSSGPTGGGDIQFWGVCGDTTYRVSFLSYLSMKLNG